MAMSQAERGMKYGRGYSKNCNCKGRSGKRKRSYRSKTDAVNEAIRSGRVSRSYMCPTEKGKWHLSHG